ncbi:MAG TPA: DUF2784 domain-containing protein [Deltaproteobacteria bacterium]|nr:DUF2784 domain-containing protein [Deltaproteobacteria bacterium]
MGGLYVLLADCVVLIHFLYVLFAAGGLVFILAGAGCGWAAVRNPWFRITHLVAVGLVALEAAVGIICPLTNWEYHLRRLSGGSVDENISFVARLARLLIFYDLPEWVFTVVHILFGLLVVVTFILVPPVFGAKKQSAGRE